MCCSHASSSPAAARRRPTGLPNACGPSQPKIAAYTAELVDALDAADTAAAATAIAEDHADLRTERLRLGPTFALSGALGGADADLIAGTLLLDLKAAATTRIVTRVGLWQLVGYALADTDDTCGLQRVGFSALRGADAGSLASTSSCRGLPERPCRSARYVANSPTSLQR